MSIYSLHEKQKGFSSVSIVVSAVLLLVLVGGAYYFFTAPTRQEDVVENEGGEMMDNDKGATDKGSMMADTQSGDTMMDGGLVGKDDADNTMKDGEGAMMDEEGNNGTMVSIDFSGSVLAGSSAKLLEFNPEDYAKAKASDKLVVLYFYANWCPVCKAEFPRMQEAFNELSTDDVVAFRVNFRDDQTSKEEEALAREFGVPHQHTKVFLKGGKQILKAPDSWSKDRYISEINKAI